MDQGCNPPRATHYKRKALGVIRSFKQKEPTMTVYIYIYRLVGMAEIYTPPPILLHSFHNTGNLK